jgi:hypothetical protein
VVDSSRADALRARLAAGPAPAWRPDQGDTNPLVGTVESLGQRTHEKYGTYPMLVVETDDGRRCWHAWSTVARQQLTDADPRPGDMVAVAFEGERVSTSSGVAYKLWRVEVERAPERAFDDHVAQAPRFEPFPDA